MYVNRRVPAGARRSGKSLFGAPFFMGNPLLSFQLPYAGLQPFDPFHQFQNHSDTGIVHTQVVSKPEDPPDDLDGPHLEQGFTVVVPFR